MSEKVSRNTVTERAQGFVESTGFQRFILVVIFLNAAVLGLETSPAIMETYGSLLITLDKAALAIFVTEIVIKLIRLSSSLFPRSLERLRLRHRFHRLAADRRGNGRAARTPNFARLPIDLDGAEDACRGAGFPQSHSRHGVHHVADDPGLLCLWRHGDELLWPGIPRLVRRCRGLALIRSSRS